MHMEQRHDAERDVLGREPVMSHDIVGRGRHVAVHDRDALGTSGAAAGVQDQRESSGEGGAAVFPVGAPGDANIAGAVHFKCIHGNSLPFGRFARRGCIVGTQEKFRGRVFQIEADFVFAVAGIQRAAVPATEAARKLTIAGKPFGRYVATRSPRRIPRDARASAISVT